MKTKLYYLITLFSISIGAQIGSNPNPVNSSIDMYPKTPEAAAMSKFVDIPAGNYTGVADFTIPLYTIEFEGEKIPIELRYTTTGVTVGQVATRVGLGWVLNTGPSLSQQVIGTQDRLFPRPILTSTFTDPNTNSTSYQIVLDALGLESNGPRDVQPDIYTYSLLNSSGKFILNPTGAFGIPMPYNQTKIVASSGNPNEIIDDKGFVYNFYNQSFSTKTKNMCYEINPLFDFDDPNFKINKITSPKKQEVKYIYVTGANSKYISSILTQERVNIYGSFIPGRPPLPLPRKCINYTYSNDIPLSEIQFKGGKVLFTYNNKNTNPRLDLDGDVYITNVKVKNDKNEVIRDFTLNYDYFTAASAVLPDELANSLMSPFSKGLDKRLKLVSVKDNLTDGIYKLEYYESYNGKKLPIRVSNDQDYWGIYNGAENGKKAISISSYENINIESEFIGANKNPDVNYGKLGNLKKIIYPTGGYSEIQYEADEYDISENPVILYDTQEEYQNENANDQIFPTVKTPFVISNNATSRTLTFIGNPNATNTTTTGMCTWNIKKIGETSVSSGQMSGTFTRTDAPGSYELWVTRDDNFPNIKCNAYYDIVNIVKVPVDTINTQKAGTIRVSKIESFDNNNNKIVREYTYKLPTQSHTLPYTKTSGINQGEQLFIAMSTQKYPLDEEGHYAVENIVSNNPGWQTATVRGKPVGYDYVQEMYTDHNFPANSYRKEYKFGNEKITQYHDPNTPLNITWPVGGLDRGILEEELLFDSSNSLVKKIVNEYQHDGYHNSKYAPNSGLYGPSGMGSGLIAVPTRKYGTSTSSYEFEYTTFSLTNHWLLNKNTTTTEYINNGADSLTIVSVYKYSIPEYRHTYRTEATSTGSKGETLKTSYKYPQDITSGDSQYTMMQKLVSKNQVADPVITKNYTNGLATSEIRTQFQQIGSGDSTMILPQSIYIKKGENATAADNKITYNSYDDQGNITQYTLESGIPVSIIWGYNKTLPIAKIEGALYNNIKGNSLVSAVVEASLNDNNSMQNVTADQTEQALISASDSLRKGQNFLNYQITTYTYDPLVGVRSVTPPSGIREYYLYDNANRLQSVYIKEKNEVGTEVIKILKENKYNYKP